jgi:16S rRNA (guanine1207-N2)-methyltransferase
MQDPAVNQLLPYLQRSQQHETGSDNLLWIADENVLHSLSAVAAAENIALITNRFDVAHRARDLGLAAQFNDFSFSALDDNAVQTVVYRVSKEKPVVHHVINQAWRVLAPGGELVLTGLKNEGIKTYIDKAKHLFGNGNARKVGNVYVGNLLKQGGARKSEPLDDQNYGQLRLIETPELDFYSKPGLFGWDRIDQGSAFLVEQLPGIMQSAHRTPQSLLDLGCGYGYLTLMTRNIALARRVATDNNAAALLAMEKNAEHYAMQVEVLADDCGGSVPQAFDLILCNPPFHQGFSVDSQLTDKFLRQTHRLLAADGMAIFVVNQFIPLERAAEKYFRRINMAGRNKSFKLIRLALR